MRGGYTPIEFPSFGGLDLRRDPQLTGPLGAIDMLNVSLTPVGTVRTRDGYATLATAAANVTNMFPFPNPGGAGDNAVVTTSSHIYSLDINFASFSAGAATTDTFFDAVTFTPTGKIYFATGAGIKSYDGATSYASVSGAPSAGRSIAVQQPDLRLAIGDAASTTGRIAFSAPGDPTTWGANDYVTLDGGPVLELVEWNNLLFAVCTRGAYVFYGNSIDNTGQPIFNYRKIAEFGVSSFGGSRQAAASSDGVYFIALDGVYRTTGGPPVKISAPLDPLFQGRAVAAFASQIYAPYLAKTVAVVSRDLWIGNGSGEYFVCDLDTGLWTHHQLAAQTQVMQVVPQNSAPRPLYAFLGNSAAVALGSPTATTDGGGVISASYRSGFWNPAEPMDESVVREWLIDGVGTVNFKVAANDNVTLGAAASVVLGTSPAVGNGRDRRAVKGRNYSFQVSTSSSAWSLSRVVANVRNQRDPGEKST